MDTITFPSFKSLLIALLCLYALSAANPLPRIPVHKDRGRPEVGNVTGDYDITKQFTIHLHQQMDHEWSELYWTLYDPRGDKIDTGKNSENHGQIKAGHGLPHTVQILVTDPTNIDKTDIKFIYYSFHIWPEGTTPPRLCHPTWTTGSSNAKVRVDNDKQSFHVNCGTDPSLKGFMCDNVIKLGWKKWKGGFEREFNCWFLGVESTI